MITNTKTFLNQLDTINPGIFCPNCNINKKFFILFEHFDGGVIIEDPSGQIGFVNKKFVEMFRLDLQLEDIIGKSSKEILSLSAHLFQDSKEYLDSIAVIFNREEANYGKHIRMKDGRVLHLDYVPVKRENFTISHMWFYKDVTRFINVQDSLKYRLELERIITELSGIFISSKMEELNFSIDYAIERIARFLMTDRSYVVLFEDNYKTFSMTNEWSAEGIDPRKEKLQNISSDILPWGVDKLKNNDIIMLHSSENLPDEAFLEKDFLKTWDVKSFIIVPLICSNTLMGCLGFSDVNKARKWDIDTTNMISVCANLISGALKRNEYETSILANQQQVFSALQKEKELNEMKSSFVSLVSHEFRTPLAAILSSAEILEYYSEKLSAEKKELQYHKIKTSINNLLDILNDVSDLNRIDSHRTILKVEEINFTIFLNKILEELDIVNKVKPEINIKTSVDELKFVSDAKLLRQIINNLVSNAIKFTPHNKRIFINSEVRDNTFFFCIEDEGIGIPIEEQGSIFQPFTRSKNAHKFKGSGLGLSIVKKAVEMMSGEITFSSTENTGTTITVILPLS